MRRPVCTDRRDDVPVRPLLRSGTDEQKQRWLPRLASDEGCLAAIAFTEPGAGSDVGGIQATARRDGDEYVLNGEKCYVTNGGIAELTIVFAKPRMRSPRSSSRRATPESPPGARNRSSACAPLTWARSSSTKRGYPSTGCSGKRARALRSPWATSSTRARRWPLPRWDRPGRIRVRDHLRERAARVREAPDREAGRLVQARGHGDADRGVATARLARRCCGGRRRGRRLARLLRQRGSLQTWP